MKTLLQGYYRHSPRIDAKMMFKPGKLLTAAAILLLSLPVLAGDVLEIGNPWTPEAPPGRMMAGFLTLTNHGQDPIVLVDAVSPQFGRVEIHTMEMDDGVMRMRRLEQLEIPPGETVELKPGGLHLMLMQPAGQFGRGDQLEITLIGADEQRFNLVSTVRPRRR
jgi:periplasmic copper chaperone A